MSLAIHWFRRDLRLADNTALLQAKADGCDVLPAFIRSTWRKQHHWTGHARQSFLCDCLRALDHDLRKKGSQLVVREGDPVKVLLKLATEAGATAIYLNRDPDPHGRAVEEALSAAGEPLGIRVIQCQDHALHEREEVLTGSGSPFRVFTPYARAWLQRPKPAPQRGCPRFSDARFRSEPLPTPASWGLTGTSEHVAAGERAARARLDRFLDGPIYTYDAQRDLPAESGTSRLSQDLRHGTLSIREIYQRCEEAARSARTAAAKRSVGIFINELIWREFYFQVLWHAPGVLDHEFLPEYRVLPWRARWRPEDESAWKRDPRAREDFEGWQHGLTGFPIVDAGMRQLRSTGFMHNRVRMIVAMFLTKDLRIWWMHGEAHFMQQLLDGEIASNNGGWQWSASTGTDAAPYFRIQNPWSQTKRFDPAGAYIKHCVPELRDTPAAALQTPPPPGESVARGYPRPMLDHAAAREETLEFFQSVRQAKR